jgi:hypothetical protein
MLRRASPVLLLLLTTALLGAQSPRPGIAADQASISQSTEMQKDLWYEKPSDFRSFTKTELGINFVDSVHVDEAIRLLDGESFVELTQTKANYFVGRDLSTDGKYILIRALNYAQNFSGYSIYRMGDRLWVYHGVLSKSNEMHRFALVLSVEEVPGKVYVSCSVSE